MHHVNEVVELHMDARPNAATRSVGLPSVLVMRRHVDLVRVSSALCPTGHR